MKKILFLTGTAGTGKTSVINELKNILPEDSYIQSSITREYFKFKEIEHEAKMASYTEDQRKQFQLDLFDFYLNYTTNKLTDNSCNMSVVDRSPIDHLSYILYNCPNLTQPEYNIVINKLEHFFIKLSDMQYNVTICEFEFPTPWLKQEDMNDGFRLAPFSKTLMTAYIQNRELDNLFKNNNILNLSYLKIPCANNSGQFLNALDRAKLII